MKSGKLILAFLTVMLLAGCTTKQKAETPEAGVYQIYYLNPGITRMVAQEYRTETTETDTLIQELMAQFQTVPAEVDSQAALGDKVVFQGYRRQDMVLYVFFDNNYTSMSGAREILCRAALAKTLTQISGIEYINIYSGDQPLTDSKGSPVGMLSGAEYVDSISDVNTFERTELVLYFTDGTGQLLYPERREVVHKINTSLERVVLEELINGPQREGINPTLDKGIKILNVSVNEKVCYINFDDSFLSNSLEVREYIPVFSIVNSLSELGTVNRVQITVNGSADVIFRDSLRLNTMFERNLDYIGGS